MAVLLNNVRISSVDFHTTEYTDPDGIRRLGWHQDTIGSDGKMLKVHLPSFDPQDVEQFVVEALALLKITPKPGGSADANARLRFN